MGNCYAIAMNTTRAAVILLLSTLACMTPACARGIADADRSEMKAAQGSVVSVEAYGGKFRILRNGEPYYVRGVGGQSRLETLAAMGGNSIRTWHIDNARHVLDDAHANGLTVTMGIWIGHPRHGFDYTNQKAIEDQRTMVRDAVLALKDHPALLFWGVGNEVELMSDPDLVFPELNTLAAMVKELDPDHPTMVVIAGGEPDKIRSFNEHCTSVDLLGVNSYAADIASVPATLKTHGYNGPYLVTEFGPRGHWQSPSAPWGAPREQTSTQKAEAFEMGYEVAIASQPERCLGSYAFLWGNKQEKTATWYGMILPTGETTAVADTMSRLWTGNDPEQHAPSISPIGSPLALESIAPGVETWAEVDTADADGDTLEYEWLIIEESRVRSAGGDPEKALKTYPDLTLESGKRATLRTPAQPGAYRLFVTVRDGTGRAATANVPFQVEAF